MQPVHSSERWRPDLKMRKCLSLSQTLLAVMVYNAGPQGTKNNLFRHILIATKNWSCGVNFSHWKKIIYDPFFKRCMTQFQLYAKLPHGPVLLHLQAWISFSVSLGSNQLRYRPTCLDCGPEELNAGIHLLIVSIAILLVKTHLVL